MTAKKARSTKRRDRHPSRRAVALRKAKPFPPVRIYMVIQRQTGDEERYLIGEVPDLRYAVDYKRKLMKVSVPKKLGPEWKVERAA